MVDRLLTGIEAAQILGISPRTVSHLVLEGKIRRVIVGGGPQRPRWRIAPQDLQRFIEEDQELLTCPPSFPPASIAAPARRPSTVVSQNAVERFRKALGPRAYQRLRGISTRDAKK